MLQFLRRHRHGSRWLAALLVAVWLVPMAFPHAPDDDPLCVLPAGGPEVPSALSSADGPADPSHHCIVCHSIRSFRSALADCGPATIALTSEARVDARLSAPHRAPSLDRLPARAPPSVSA